MTDDSGSRDDPDPTDETTELPKTSKLAAPLRVTKGVGHPGWMGRPVNRRFRIRRSTALMVVLFVGFELLHIQYPSQPKAASAPNGYIPAFIPAVTTTTTAPPSTTTTTQPPAASTTTSTVAPGAKASTTTTSTTRVGGATTSTTGVGGATTTTTSPGVQGASTTTTTTTSTTVP